jgi:hypothetical protein
MRLYPRQKRNSSWSRLSRESFEKHVADGHERTLLVHRKGSTRAFVRENFRRHPYADPESRVQKQAPAPPARFAPVSARSLDHLLMLLKRSPRGAVFNPWWQSDEENDIGPRAPGIRREQFRAYVAGRLGKARLALVGEGLGYRGGHFTGIAMTSERILFEGVQGRRVLSGVASRRTSRPDRWPRGFAEPTASIVWSALLGLGLSANAFVLWNVFPWHPFDRERGMLSNRKPTRAELAAGALALKAFLDLFPEARLVAVGRLAASQLASEECVRHPASAGAALFRRQIAAIVQS